MSDKRRARARTEIDRRDERARASSSSSGYQSPRPGISQSRRPGGEPYSHSSVSYSSGPSYARPSLPSDEAAVTAGAPSTSAAAGPSSYYPTTARGEHLGSTEQHRPAVTAYSETASETASVAGSVAGSEAARGSFRGRRMLPMDIVTRPRHLVTKQGAHGQPVLLKANYFKLLSTPDWCLQKYRVDIEPEEDRNVIRKGLLRAHRQTLGAYIFDGTLLYSTRMLPKPLELTSQRESDNQLMSIKIRHVGQLNKGDYEYVAFFNIIMRKCLDLLELKLLGRNYFDPHKKTEVREYRLELLPGYFTSIRQHENDILMCAEITHKVMRSDTLLHLLKECYQTNPHDYQRVYKNTVIGSVVLTYYNDNSYKVDDVDFSVTPKSTFMKKNDEISYSEYYRTRYNVTITEMRQPLLVSKAKARDRRAGKSEMVYLIPELCKCTGLTDSMRNDNRLMSALAKFTRVSPVDRIKKLMNFNQRLHGVPAIAAEIQSWNLELDRKLVDVPARVLTCDKIIYGDNSTTPVNTNANWTGDLRYRSMRVSGSLDEWVLLVPNRLKRDAQNFISSLIKAASGMNFRINYPKIIDLRDDNPSTYVETLEIVMSKKVPLLIFCIASNNRLDRYAAIKKKCCVDRPVPTQVLLARSLQNKSIMSVATKVAIQLNCKIGGIPWTVAIPLNGLMVVGFDVCHDTNSKTKDFGAMVASLDSNHGRYFSAVSSHTSGEELSHDLSVNLLKAIKQFKEVNNTLPKRIVIYRDGVGDGQTHYVVRNEVAEVKAKLQSIYENPDDLKLAYIIVTKKINTRLFYNEQNPKPGTVVDDVITDPSKYDFFIVAQQVNQGTVTPTAYNVIEDSLGLEVDKIQRLTYKLCHMYFNWSGTVRVPAPCQYAHKLAFLVSQAVHQQPSTYLETLLYFL
ncbi:piwi-like protein Siwi isoform X2 [Copidosoma floridanum]|nr:piwi-like protein Siwi isoform X2 [Copidosoma floridanum]XP_014210003.1 piwi-like protein Siwi isoform X2 [Copidosoma floridanum]